MATKVQKNEKIEEIKKIMSKAKVAIVTDYRGLTVSEITELRRNLQKENGEYSVVKNTLAIKAIEGTEYAGLAEYLKGPTALALGFEDQVAPARIVSTFIKKTKKAEIKGGVLDGKAFSAEEVNQLAQLPSREELYAKMLGSINSPATGIVGCVTGVMSGLVRVIDQVRQQKESA